MAVIVSFIKTSLILVLLKMKDKEIKIDFDAYPTKERSKHLFQRDARFYFSSEEELRVLRKYFVHRVRSVDTIMNGEYTDVEHIPEGNPKLDNSFSVVIQSVGDEVDIHYTLAWGHFDIGTIFEHEGELSLTESCTDKEFLEDLTTKIKNLKVKEI